MGFFTYFISITSFLNGLIAVTCACTEPQKGLTVQNILRRAIRPVVYPEDLTFTISLKILNTNTLAGWSTLSPSLVTIRY